MKKILLILTLFAILFLCACDDEVQKQFVENEIVIDFDNEKVFEEALNNKEDVTGKTVKFVVEEYAPESILGINCHSGEHLNFISEEELDVGVGDVVVGRIIKKPSKFLGSWKVPYEVISITKSEEIVSAAIEELEQKWIETTETVEETVIETEETTEEESVQKETIEEITQEQTEDAFDEELSEEVYSEENDEPSILQVHYIDVGQSDATLLVCEGEAMLIDAGDDTKGTTVQLYLKKQGITSLKYLVLTHTDSDHIGGSDVIITKFDIENIFLSDFKKDNNVYRDMMDAMEYKRYTYSTPSVGSEFSLGSATFTILAPNKTYDNPNDSSIALMVRNGDNKFLFSGDAQIEAEGDILRTGFDLSCDVFKAAHHGSKSSNGKNFIKAIKPTYVVISCGKDNSYGHPHQGPMDRYKYYNASIFRTDEQGTIVATSDGINITWNNEPSTTWAYGTGTDTTAGEAVSSGVTTIEQIKENSKQETQKDEVTKEEQEPQSEPQPIPEPQPVPEVTDGNSYIRDYILNTNTHKFHYPQCKSVKQMKEKNKQAVTMSRDEIIGMGYVPCKNCNP